MEHRGHIRVQAGLGFSILVEVGGLGIVTNSRGIMHRQSRVDWSVVDVGFNVVTWNNFLSMYINIYIYIFWKNDYVFRNVNVNMIGQYLIYLAQHVAILRIASDMVIQSVLLFFITC